jgi:hypothetical protein
MVLRALGRRRDDDIVGSGRMTVLSAWGRRGSMVLRAWERRWVHSVALSGRTTLLWAREPHHGLGDVTYVVDDITGSGRGRWRCVKGLNCGRERWRGGFGEDSTMAWRIQGGR